MADVYFRDSEAAQHGAADDPRFGSTPPNPFRAASGAPRPRPRTEARSAAPASPEEPAGPSRIQALTNATGALVSLALVAGLGLWGYRLAVRDVSGVPVIQALEGPARIAPSDPGGELARHQGLAVNAVTAEGEAAPPPDRLMLAPRPEALTGEDAAMGALAAGADAPVAEPAAAADPLTGLPLGPDGQIVDPLTTAAGPIEVIPASIPGVVVSPRPLARPAPGAIRDAALPSPEGASEPASEDALVAAVFAAVAADTDGSGAGTDADPATLAPGTRLVQLGSYPSDADARAGWDEVASGYGPLMAGKRRVIEPVESGGTTLYRLRVEGFADLADARRFCAALDGAVPACVPTLAK